MFDNVEKALIVVIVLCKKDKILAIYGLRRYRKHEHEITTSSSFIDLAVH